MTRKTSLEVYERIKREGLLSERRQQVYDILYEFGPLTGGQVAVKMRLDHGVRGVSESVRNRLTELREWGCVEELEDIDCPVTGNRSILWDVNGKAPEKPKEKRKRKFFVVTPTAFDFSDAAYSAFPTEAMAEARAHKINGEVWEVMGAPLE